MRRIFLLVFLLLGLSVFAQAAIDAYDFKTPEEEQRFNTLTEELRCPKCQNQNLAGSGSGIAKDLKDRIYQLMQEGKSDDEIKAYLIERYGDFITYKPPFRAGTVLLWLGPFTLLLIVAAILILRVRRPPAAAAPISEDERQRLKALLDEADHRP